MRRWGMARGERAAGGSSGARAPRRATTARSTRETSVSVTLALDGRGRADVATGVPFLDHMLDSFARHGLFDLDVKARGDLEVDQHHTVEDVGLTLGAALREALGEKVGIRRFGEATVPLDEALVSAVVDLGGRPYLVYELDPGRERVGSFDPLLVHDFLLALVNEARMNLHIECVRGRNPHHMIEAAFKALARALDAASSIDPRVTGVPSTKGAL